MRTAIRGAQIQMETGLPYEKALEVAEAQIVAELTAANPTPRQNGPSNLSPLEGRKKWEIDGTWEHEARAIGKSWMLAEEGRTGVRPGVEAIARYVEGELSNRGTTGKRGRFLDWGTVKREALTGVTERKARGRK